MLARPKLTKPTNKDEASKPKGQARPTEERFLLRVDHQTKRSFSSNELAIAAGTTIKKAFPLVVVTIEDTVDGGINVLEA